MIRSCFLWCKHVVYAVLALALIGCFAEVALRVYDSATAQVTRRDLYDRGMLCKSWFVHHTLKPAHAFAAKNPDTGQRIRIAINSLGTRGAEPAIPRPSGLLRLVCLGDDATFAPAIAENETFTARLEAELGALAPAGVEVLNAGVPDYCPLLSYLQYRHQLMPLEPDLIVFTFDMSDVSDDYQLRRHAVMTQDGTPLCCAHPALELRGASGKPRQECVFLTPEFARQQVNRILADRVLGEKSRSIESAHCRYLWLEDQPPDWSIYVTQALGPLHHLDELARSSGARLVVAALPAPWQISASASSGPGVREKAGVGADACFKSRRPFETVAEFCRTHQIPFCDVSESFAAQNKAERLFLDNSPALSSAGHALYARELAGFVRAQLIQASPGASGGTSLPPQARLPPR